MAVAVGAKVTSRWRGRLFVALLVGLAICGTGARSQVQSSIDGQSLLDFLNQMIGWYRQVSATEALATEPEEVSIANDNLQLSQEVAGLSFDYARAEAQTIVRQSGSSGANLQTDLDSRPLGQKLADSDQQVQQLQTQLDDLKAQEGSASRGARKQLSFRIAALQNQLELAQTRQEVLRNILQFETGPGANVGTPGLVGDIEQLARSVPEANRAAHATATSSTATAARAGAPAASTPAPAAAAPAISVSRRPQPSGVVGLISDLLSLTAKLNNLKHAAQSTNALLQTTQRHRERLAQDLATLMREGDQLAAQQASVTDAASLARQKTALTTLTARYKQQAAALVPLGRSSALLRIYAANLARWDRVVDRESADETRSLMVRLAGVLVVFALLAVAARIWRRAVFHYVHDVRRRYYLLQARRVILTIIIVIILALSFATEIGSVATIMGFATAGIAFALQNVILSVAAYFLLIGRFGIHVGDQVQIGSVIGEVVDIGLVKLHLMELSSGHDRQPTGRIVVFSNSVVFQPTGNFFKQIPGTNFVWNEISLMLAPETDYKVAEKRLMEAVNEVFASYSSNIERQYAAMEQMLNVAVDKPHPQIRLQLSEAGLQVIIRYPAEATNAAEIADRVTRRVSDALREEPTLRLVGQATPNIQPVPTEAESDQPVSSR